jgi:pentose-5-phosphate-3-epimerase
MSVIIPAILPSSLEDLQEKLTKLSGVAEEVQIDIVDESLGVTATWPFIGGNTKTHLESNALSELGPFRFEVDLMVRNPEQVVGDWIHAGATRITIHVEMAHELPKLIQDFQTTYGHDKDFAPDLLSFGLAINVATDASLLGPYLTRCDYVQFMGIEHIGKQGQPFDRRVLSKINSFHKKFPNIPLQVDGGVSLQTAPDLLRAGVSKLVVGSALGRTGNVKEEYRKFQSLSEMYGLYT